ncbi:hypothetical protein [Thermococcus sp. AM4]|uniref:hypothetical protein n=1 Tax=Thermococcus sp. (strain AM4) TaxID=246969 RepID=UPI0001871386|nr:hypothetical protein [Thermococcus sp. AM4]EEB72922.1 hypothetical protein TAM4_1029 [Thermococcus sp. AM4]
MPVRCIKCGVTSGRRSNVDYETFICDECKQHEQVVISLYETAKETFLDPSAPIEASDIYEILKQTYFVIQKNPKLSVYAAIVKELLEAFAIQNLTEIDYDELWRRTRSRRNILKVLKSMEDAEILKLESPDRISRVVKPGPVLENFAKVYRVYKAKEQAKTRVASVLTMYAILHELYVLAKLKTKTEIENTFGVHSPKAPWVATMFLWTTRLTKGEEGRHFTEDEFRKFLAKRGLSTTTISNYISALKAINPNSVQQFIENIQPTGNNGVEFIVREDLIRALERIYASRVRENARD